MAFHEAVARAEAAIRRHLAGPRLGFDRPRLTRQAVLSRLRAMARAGETLTPELLVALIEVLEGDLKPRRRGRPPGRRGTHDPEGAAMAGLRAVAGSPLPVFGAPFGPGYSRCAAVAEAMRRCGFRQYVTPAAVANVARQWRRRLRAMRPLAAVMAQFAARAEEMRRVTDALTRLNVALSAYSAVARGGAHPALARYAKADFTRTINGLGLFKKSGN